MDQNKIERQIPVIDISELLKNEEDQNQEILQKTVNEIHLAMKNIGFMYIKGCNISSEFMDKVMQLAKEFFALPLEEKKKIHIKDQGMSWRGYFECGYELTSGKPDQKEGYYFGNEHDKDQKEVVQKFPTFGQNVWPEKEIPQFKETFYEYWGKLRKVAEAVFEGISLGLGLEKDYMKKRFTSNPTVLFRIFNYPEHNFPADADEFGVREHTDYGFLTILKQDNSGGLEVRNRDGEWISAPPIEDTFVVNIGDMLELWTHSIYKATPHRVKNKANHDRISMPYFYDPNWDSTLERIPKQLLDQDQLEEVQKKHQNQRWDGVDISHISKDVTYGDYLWKKISKVFPELAESKRE